jgi:hypothetical protein
VSLVSEKLARWDGRTAYNQPAEEAAELATGTGGTRISSVVAREPVDVNREEGGGCLCGLDECYSACNFDPYMRGIGVQN